MFQNSGLPKVSRVSKIRDAVLAEINDENVSYFSQGGVHEKLSAEGQLLRQTYAEHKRKRNSKSRDRSANAGINRSNFITTNQMVNDSQEMYSTEPGRYRETQGENIASNSLNKFKRSQNSDGGNFQLKHQKLEENFKKFTAQIQEKRQQSKSPPPNKTKNQSITDISSSAKQIQLLGFTYNINDFQHNSSVLSTNEPIGDRQMALRIMLKQVQNFLHTMLTQLQQLSMAKDQEIKLNEMYIQISKELQYANDQKQVENVLEQITQQVQALFSQIMTRIFQIGSETYINHKFRDICKMFECLLQESYRLQVNDLMPTLINSIKLHRTQSGLVILNSALRNNQRLKITQYFKRWNGKPERIHFLSSVCRHINRIKNLRSVAFSFSLWSSLAHQEKQETNYQQLGLLSRLIVNKEIFDQCMIDDAGLINNIQSIVKLLYAEECDIILLKGETSLQYFDYQSEVIKEISTSSVSQSLTMQAVQGTDKINYIQKVLANKQFDDRIDRPFNQNGDFEKNNQDYSVFIIPLYKQEECNEPSVKIALLRVFSAVGKKQNKRFSDKMLGISTQIQGFINRIYQIRSSVEILSEELEEQQEQSRLTELEKAVHNCLFDILRNLNHGTKEDFILLLQERTQILLTELLSPGEIILRQIFLKSKDPQASLLRIVETPLLAENGSLCLVRKRDHREENQDILIDYIDYQKDNLIQQISIDTTQMTMILHKKLPFESKRDNHIHKNIRFALKILGKCIEPVLSQGLKIHDDLAYKVELKTHQLYRQAQSEETRTFCRQKLIGLSILEENEGFTKFCQIMSEAFQNFFGQNYVLDEFAVLLNVSIFSGLIEDQNNLMGHLTNNQVRLIQLPEHINELNQQENNNLTSRYEVSSNTFRDLKSQLLHTDERTAVEFPVYNDQKVLLAIVAINLKCEKQFVEDLKLFTQSLRLGFTEALERAQQQSLEQGQFKESLRGLQDKIQTLQIDIDFMQGVQEHLVLPFTQQPSLQTLGFALATLTTKTIPMVQTKSVQLFINGYLVNDDIRMMLFTQNGYQLLLTQTVTINEDVILILLPSSQNRSILLNLTFEDLSQASILMEHIEVYQQIIAPFVATALSSLTQSLLPATQEHLPRVLLKIIQKRELSFTASFIMKLREFQVNRVPIFTRLNSYKRVLKLKPYINDQYLENERREFLTKQHVLEIYARAFQTFNKFATQTKHNAFSQYKMKVLELLQQEHDQFYAWTQSKPTKQQRKSFSIIAQIAQRLKKRASFSKFAVKCKVFRYLNNPHTKALGAALCIQHNFTQIRMRISFDRMRGNAANRCYRDFAGIGMRDRDFMVHLQRDLLNQLPKLNSIEASHELEDLITSILERAMVYLQKTLLPESLDVIVCSLEQVSNKKKFRAYLFNKSPDNISNSDQILRVDASEIMDAVTTGNINYIGSEVLQDFNLSFKKDIILQMLAKANSMFNFSNISNSLYDLYLNQFGKSPQDKGIISRMVLLKKSKSALLCPLSIETSEGDINLIGSLELYRFYGQIFDSEVESRIRVFTRQLQDVCNLFLRMRQTQLQISDLRQELALSGKPVSSLTSLLRNIQSKAPSSLKAPHFQCLILNGNGLAYFYSFKDSFIYNFRHEGTLIDDIMEQQSVLELASSTSDKQPETMFLADLEDSVTSAQQHRMRQIPGLLKSITNVDGFRRLFYYPVVCDGKIRAIFEIGYTKDDQVPAVIMNDVVVSLISQFSCQLSQQLLKIRTLCSSTEQILLKKQMLAKQNAFIRWKHGVTLTVTHQQYESQRSATIAQTQQCLSDYLQNLENYDQELKKLSEQKQTLTAEVNALQIDRYTKFKLLATCLTIVHKMEKARTQRAVLSAFQSWKANAAIARAIEAAFNKMLELNYRHANGRFQAAAYLLKRSCNRRLKKVAFESIATFSNLTQMSVGGGKIASFTLESGMKSARSNINHPFLSSNKNPSYLGQQQFASDSNSNNFTNIAGPFQKTQITNTSQKNAHSMIYTGQATPIITNINVQNSHLKELHEKLGFGAVPKGTSKREGTALSTTNASVVHQPAVKKKKRSKSKSAGRSAPQTGRIVNS